MTQFYEQRDMISELTYRESKMNREDYDLFQIFKKRQKDEEDFDKESFEKLKNLYDKYVVKLKKSFPK